MDKIKRVLEPGTFPNKEALNILGITYRQTHCSLNHSQMTLFIFAKSLIAYVQIFSNKNVISWVSWVNIARQKIWLI